MRQFKQPKKNNNYVEPSTVEERRKLQAKSLLAFGRKNHYQQIMRRGRPVFDKAGNFEYTAIITAKEISDTMDYILKEREEKQKKILEEMENVGLRSKANDESGSDRPQQSGGDETSREGEESSSSSKA